jgi:hypothetical protein
VSNEDNANPSSARNRVPPIKYKTQAPLRIKLFSDMFETGARLTLNYNQGNYHKTCKMGINLQLENALPTTGNFIVSKHSRSQLSFFSLLPQQNT